MELDSHSAAGQAFCEPSQTAQPTLQIVAEPDVEDFVSSRGLQDDYAMILQRMEKIFTPSKISVLLLSGTDDDSADERLTFLVQCEMDRRSFRLACERFYLPLRIENSVIYARMGILQDL